MVREVTGHGAFLTAGGRVEEGKPRQPKESVAEPQQQTDAEVGRKESEVDSLTPVKKAVQSAGPELRYEVDSELDQVVIKILDGKSGDVIRQIPAEEQLRLAKVLEEGAGQVVSKHA